MGLILGFQGTSGMSRDNPGQSCCPFVLGQNNFLVPPSLCHGTKKILVRLSLFPRTRAASKIPSRPILWQNIKTLACPTSWPRVWLAIPACPVLWQDFELFPLSLCPGTTKDLLSLCPKKLHCPVTLETLVSTIQIECHWILLQSRALSSLGLDEQ